MLFNPRAALSEIRNKRCTPATSATFATPEPKSAIVTEIVTVKPTHSEGNPSQPLVDRSEAKSNRSAAGSLSQPKRLSVGGRPMTQTGRIVSWEEWRNMHATGGEE